MLGVGSSLLISHLFIQPRILLQSDPLLLDNFLELVSSNFCALFFDLFDGKGHRLVASVHFEVKLW